MDSVAYARQLRQLLPRGILWTRRPDSRLAQVFAAIAEELARVDTRGLELLEEADPRTATETLEDWERLLALPDEVVTEIPLTDEARRAAVTSKLVRQGGQTAAFFVALVLAAGYPAAEVEELGETVFRAGRGRCGDPLRGVAWAHAWILRVTDSVDPGVLPHATLEAVIRRAKPAHTVVIFEYV